MDLMTWKVGIKELEEVIGRGKTYSDIQQKALERYVYKKQRPSSDEWAWAVAGLAASWKWTNLPSPADILEKLKAARSSIDGNQGSIIRIDCPRCLREGYLWTRRDRWDEADPGLKKGDPGRGLDSTGQEPLGRQVIRCGCGNSPPGKGLTYLEAHRAGAVNAEDWENANGMRMDETVEILTQRNWEILGRMMAGKGRRFLFDWQVDRLMGDAGARSPETAHDTRRQLRKIDGGVAPEPRELDAPF